MGKGGAFYEYHDCKVNDFKVNDFYVFLVTEDSKVMAGIDPGWYLRLKDQIVLPVNFCPFCGRKPAENNKGVMAMAIKSTGDELQTQPETFREALRRNINCHSMENSSNTPDFILAQYLLVVLEAFDQAVQKREAWYGRDVSSLDKTVTPQSLGSIELKD